MTGYGRKEVNIENYQLIIEIKSLNGKQMDINTRLSSNLRMFEHDIRNIINDILKRGTVEASISLKQNGSSKNMTINTQLAINYYQGIQQIANHLQLSQDHILASLISLPEVICSETEIISDELWLKIKSSIIEVLNDLKIHRLKEGDSLKNDLVLNLEKIIIGLNQIAPFETTRIEKIRNRIKNNIDEIIPNKNIDMNRFEQELIYYIEKIDISEEKVRLQQHCKYFKEIMEQKEDESKGKKLGFLSQEIGREINTLGSKANDASIQKIIVNMKDHLEKLKEQVLNIL